MHIKIIGAGGHSKVVIDALSFSKENFQISLCDSNMDLWNTEVCGLLVESTEALAEFVGLTHVAIGNNQAREQISNTLNTLCTPYTIIHPKAIVAASAKIGLGSFIAASAILGPESAIGPGAIINHGAIVDHEVTIGAYSHIAPNSTLGGRVRIGAKVLVGSGAVILPGVTVGDEAIIAAGAVVIKDVESHTTVKGVPAMKGKK